MRINQTTSTKLHRVLLCIVIMTVAGCSNMTTTQQRALSGAGIGAGVGAVGTAMTGGCVSCGAAIGAGAGAVGGYIYDQSEQHR
jgi:osmotically inducible lipoprotein OsmB